jgi:hypothetical protein
VLQTILFLTVPALDATARVDGGTCREKHPLPRPLFGSVGIFTGEGLGQIDGTKTFFDILSVKRAFSNCFCSGSMSD